MPCRFRPLSVLCVAASIVAASTACSSAPTPLCQQEQFDTTASPYARAFHAKSDATCEAARRALLGRDYVPSLSRVDTVDGSKNFQPSNGSHVVISFHVVCAEANINGTSSMTYVSAVQDRYTLKKTSTSTSMGLNILGLVSLSIGPGDDSMMKVAGEMIPVGVFYERYFNLVDYFLKIDPARKDHKVTKVAEREHVVPLPKPASTPQDEPMKVTAPVVPTPAAPPIPVVAPASTPVSAPAPTPVSAPAAAPAPKALAEAAPTSAPTVTIPTAPATAPSPAPASKPASSATGRTDWEALPKE